MKFGWGVLVAVCMTLRAGADEFGAVRERGEKKFELKHYDLVIEQLERIPEAERTHRDRSYLAWSRYFLYAPDEALKGFRKNLEEYPDCVDDLCGGGWALLGMGHTNLAVVLFRNALEYSPAYEPAVAGYNASSGERIRANRSYGSVSYFGTGLAYQGDTPRTHGYVHDFQLKYGLTGLGYFNLMVTRSDIQTADGFDAYHQTEVRPGGGFYAGGALWRGAVGYLNYADAPEDSGKAWFGGFGAEYLNGTVNPFVDVYGYESDLAQAAQVVPGLAYAIGPIQLRSSLEMGHYELNLKDDDYGAYFQQTLQWRVTPRQIFSGGIGLGESYYGMRGAGSVFYSLPDKRLVDTWLQWGMTRNPWAFSIGGSYARFEGLTGNPYNSFGATFSLTRYWDGIPD